MATTLAAATTSAATPSGPAAGPNRTTSHLRPTTQSQNPAWQKACSFSLPVCVHAPNTTPTWAFSGLLQEAEYALSSYRTLGLPMPLGDAQRGGSSEYDLYITFSENPSITLADPETEPLPTDQAAAYTLFPVPSTTGCDFSFEVAERVAEALLFRLDAGAERGMFSAASSYLASLVSPCAAVETPAVDRFQAEPHRALTEPTANLANGALLFPKYLEENGSSAAPGKLITSLFAIASQKSDPASLTWENEPDTFDALRSSLKFHGGTLDDLLLGFAVDRAFVGNRSDGAHLLATEHYGAAGRVFFEWSVPYSSLPRRLAPAHPLEPTGATYLWVDLAGAPSTAEITFVADWELPAVYRWSIVKVDKNGAESGRIDVTSIFGTNHVERTIILREELAGLLLVGTFTGSLDRTVPFDPDLAPFMPHSYEVTLYGPINAAPTPDNPKL